MAVVTLTASKTMGGSQVADLLNGGTTGVDIGTVANNAVSPTQNLYIRHNGAQKITGAAFFLQQFSGIYGGNYTPSADFAKIISLGDAGYGLQFDEDWNRATPFSVLFQVKTGAGDSFANRRNIASSAMSYNNSGTESDPSAPVTGEIGPVLNNALGEQAHLKYRMSIPAAEVDGGIRQFDLVIAYSYTT